MHDREAIERVKLTELAMDIQVLATDRLDADKEKSEDHQDLVVLGASLNSLAHRCIQRDADEHRDHAEMRKLAWRICDLLERRRTGSTNEAAA